VLLHSLLLSLKLLEEMLLALRGVEERVGILFPGL
jgi:hypothetical protein